MKGAGFTGIGVNEARNPGVGVKGAGTTEAGVKEQNNLTKGFVCQNSTRNLFKGLLGMSIMMFRIEMEYRIFA